MTGWAPLTWPRVIAYARIGLHISGHTDHWVHTRITASFVFFIKRNTECSERPGVSAPGYATSRLRPANQLPLLPYANAVYRMSQNRTQFCVWSQQKMVATARHHYLRDLKLVFRLIIYRHISTKTCKFGEDRCGKCGDSGHERNR